MTVYMDGQTVQTREQEIPWALTALEALPVAVTVRAVLPLRRYLKATRLPVQLWKYSLRLYLEGMLGYASSVTRTPVHLWPQPCLYISIRTQQ